MITTVHFFHLTIILEFKQLTDPDHQIAGHLRFKSTSKSHMIIAKDELLVHNVRIWPCKNKKKQLSELLKRISN